MQQRQAYKTGAGATRLGSSDAAAGETSIRVMLHGQIKPLR
jgi:hypothetical protein